MNKGQIYTDMAKAVGVELFEEFLVNGARYKFTGSGLFRRAEHFDGFEKTLMPVETLVNHLRKLPFTPNTGQKYFYPDFIPVSGANSNVWGVDDETDKRIRNRVGVFKTRQEAIEQGIKLGFLPDLKKGEQ